MQNSNVDLASSGVDFSETVKVIENSVGLKVVVKFDYETGSNCSKSVIPARDSEELSAILEALSIVSNDVFGTGRQCVARSRLWSKIKKEQGLPEHYSWDTAICVMYINMYTEMNLLRKDTRASMLMSCWMNVMMFPEKMLTGL